MESSVDSTADAEASLRSEDWEKRNLGPCGPRFGGSRLSQCKFLELLVFDLLFEFEQDLDVPGLESLIYKLFNCSKDVFPFGPASRSVGSSVGFEKTFRELRHRMSDRFLPYGGHCPGRRSLFDKDKLIREVPDTAKLVCP